MTGQWEALAETPPPCHRVHVLPLGDLIEHDDIGDDCPCAPRFTVIPNPGGPDGWVITHHSLDGREQHEQ